jgi:hypothetical protein
MGKNRKPTTTQTQEQTASTALDPRAQAHVNAMRDMGSAAAQAALGFQTQGMTPDQLAAMQQMGSPFQGINLDQYRMDLGQGPQVQGTGPGVNLDQYRTDIGQMPQVQGPGGPQQVGVQGGPQAYDPSSYQAFMDPYQQEVIQGVQGDFDRQRQMAMQSGGQQATAQGALGGSRQAVLQAQMMGDVNRNEAATLAQMRSGGFQQAQQAAMGQHGQMQGLGAQYAGMGLQGQMANQQAGLAAGGQNLQAQMANQQAALGQAGLSVQQGLGFGGMASQQDQAFAGMDLQGQMANQQAAMGMAGLGVQQNLGLGGMATQQNQAMAGLNMQRAGQQFGMGEQQRQIMQQQEMDPYTRHMMGVQAMGGSLGPYGQTSTGTMSGTTRQQGGGNVFGDILGGALSGFAMGGPWGALAGGAAGGLMSGGWR